MFGGLTGNRIKSGEIKQDLPDPVAKDPTKSQDWRHLVLEDNIELQTFGELNK